MSQEIVIHAGSGWDQAALIENGHITEVDMEVQEPDLRVGDLFYAKIARILTPLKMVFVEMGRSRTALLHFADVRLPEGAGFTEPGQFLRVGNLILVQITKLPIDDKGAVVSMAIQLIGAMVIGEPLKKGINVAKRITDEAERQRLWTILNKHGSHFGGMIRSLAAHQSAEDILREWDSLVEQWQSVLEAIKGLKKPALIRREHPFICTFVREHLSSNLDTLFVDDAVYYEELKDYLAVALPMYLPMLKKVSKTSSPWKALKIDKTIKELLESKVLLPSGGFILIEKTQTMTVVDVNTGSFVKAKNEIDIIYQTNIEAAKMIAHHIRLRNISGNVVIDFIRMQEAEQQENIMLLLNEAFSHDNTFNKIFGFSPLGLVEISRQRKGNNWIEQYKHE